VWVARRALVGAVLAVAVAAGPAEARRKKEPEPAPSPATQLPANSGQPIVADVDGWAKAFLDLDAESVKARLGEPRLLRHEPPAQVWQYGDRHCALLLVLYEPKSGRGAPRVAFARAIMRDGYAARADLCLSDGKSDQPPNASALPPASPVVIPGRPFSGTPIYSEGDPPPPSP
jgi:hypothetical protein